MSSKPSLYGRLRRYPDQPGRSQSENFLTEALVGLLERMPRDVALTFVSDLLLEHGRVQTVWRDYMAKRPNASLEWKTQHHIHEDGSRYLDILLLVGGYEAIAIETKVWAQFQYHKADTPEPVHQLATYGRWLRRRCGDRPWLGALALLTQQTERAPADFLDTSSSAYGVDFRVVRHWQEVWQWLRTTAKTHRNFQPNMGAAWLGLCDELAQYFEEEGMAGSALMLDDVTAAENYLDVFARLDRAFQAIVRATETVRRELELGSVSKLEVSAKDGLIWQWAYFRRDRVPPEWYIGWGLRFPTSTVWLAAEPPLNAATSVFVILTAENPPLVPTEKLPPDACAGWSRLPATQWSGLVSTVPLSELPLDTASINDAAAHWVLGRIGELRRVVQILHESSGLTA